jgi:GTP-binding protein LepA
VYTIENVSDLERINGEIKEYREMIMTLDLISRREDESNLYAILEARRSEIISRNEISSTQLRIIAEIPMSEVVDGLNHEIKTITRGYGSFEVSFKCYRKADIELLRIEIMDEEVDAFKFLVHKKKAYDLGKKITKAFREYIERHLFQVSIRAKVRNKTIASEILKPRGKNVLAKCYGGDYTRKRKLIEKQKEGKAKMKEFGKVHVKPENLNKIFKSLSRDKS